MTDVTTTADGYRVAVSQSAYPVGLEGDDPANLRQCDLVWSVNKATDGMWEARLETVDGVPTSGMRNLPVARRDTAEGVFSCLIEPVEAVT
jgi:hypothetical protein